MMTKEWWVGFRPLCLLVGLAWLGTPAAFAHVTLGGLLGEKALISVNGGPPKVMAVGEVQQGVRLLAVRGQEVEVEEGGRRRTVALGFTGGGTQNAPAAKTQIYPDERGQFTVRGSVNGSGDTLFLVDTGATYIVLPRSLADRAGVHVESGNQTPVSTANGQTRAYKVTLNSVQVGEVKANLVEALVMDDKQLRFPLLGMSFLNRFNMRREGEQLTLTPRY